MRNFKIALLTSLLFSVLVVGGECDGQADGPGATITQPAAEKDKDAPNYVVGMYLKDAMGSNSYRIDRIKIGDCFYVAAYEISSSSSESSICVLHAGDCTNPNHGAQK